MKLIYLFFEWNLKKSLEKLAKNNDDYKPLLEQAKKIGSGVESQKKSEKLNVKEKYDEVTFLE